MICILFFLVFCQYNVFASQHHKRLFSHLFYQYDDDVVPVEYATDSMPITVENIKLLSILNIVIYGNQFIIRLCILKYFRMKTKSWIDSELVWCPASYGGIKKIAFSVRHVWSPDIVISTGVDEVFLKGNDVALLSTGRVYYYSYVRLTMSCLNHTHINNMECNFALGSWTLLTDIVHLYLQNEHIDITDCIVDPMYRIKSNSLVERNVLMTNFPMPWKLITARIQLEKIADKNSTLPNVLKLKRNK